MSTVNIAQESVGGFNAGSDTIGTSPQPLAAPYPVKKHVVVRANGANASVVIVGPTEESAASGFILSAGQQTPPIYVDNVSKVFVVGGAANQGYSWISS